jgi:hypothetical protein
MLTGASFAKCTAASLLEGISIEWLEAQWSRSRLIKSQPKFRIISTKRKGAPEVPVETGN